MAAWMPALNGANLLVIGGGQLLMDDCLKLPVEISKLRKGSKDAAGALYYHSVWGWKILVAGSPFITSSCPGRGPQDHIAGSSISGKIEPIFPGLSSQLTFDPAIWAADVYPFSGPKTGNQNNRPGGH